MKHINLKLNTWIISTALKKLKNPDHPLSALLLRICPVFSLNTTSEVYRMSELFSHLNTTYLP